MDAGAKDSDNTGAEDSDNACTGGFAEEDGYDNAQNPLILVAELSAHYNSVSVGALNKFALTCKAARDAVQWRIEKSRELRRKWSPVFAPKLERHMRARMIDHPIEYTGRAVKTIPVTAAAFDNYGLKFLDIGAPMFSDAVMSTTRLAFVNICFLTRSPDPFVAMLFLGNQAVASVNVSASRYVDLGSATPECRAKFVEKYGDDESDHPGRYFVDLSMPTRVNPIVFGRPIINPMSIRLCIAENYVTSYNDAGEPETYLCFDPAFVAQNFSHMFIHFNTVDESSYDWAAYGLAFNDEIGLKGHASRASFLRRLDDPRLATRSQDGPNAEIITTNVLVHPPPGSNLPPMQFNVTNPTMSRDQLVSIFAAIMGHAPTLVEPGADYAEAGLMQPPEVDWFSDDEVVTGPMQPPEVDWFSTDDAEAGPMQPPEVDWFSDDEVVTSYDDID